MSDTATITRTKIKIAKPTMWKVVLLNDDRTPFDFVIFVLQDIFAKPLDEAVRITISVHEKGRGIVAVYTKDIAETKVSEVMSAAQSAGFPLTAIAEPE